MYWEEPIVSKPRNGVTGNGAKRNNVTSLFFFFLVLDFSKLLSGIKILRQSFCPKKISSSCILDEGYIRLRLRRGNEQREKKERLNLTPG